MFLWTAVWWLEAPDQPGENRRKRSRRKGKEDNLLITATKLKHHKMLLAFSTIERIDHSGTNQISSEII